jgi:hypothetical protein
MARFDGINVQEKKETEKKSRRGSLASIVLQNVLVQSLDLFALT